MIATGDAIAIYGAVLATALAAIQYRQWKSAQEILTFKIYEKPFNFPAPIDATITNITSHMVYLEFVGIGYSYRSYWKPWKITFLGLNSMKVAEDGFASGKGAEGALEPGKTMEVYFEEKDFQRLERPNKQHGFNIRLCAWIDHSGSDQTFRKSIA
jgi:hypothetical protein